jgi:hypothetical protein
MPLGVRFRVLSVRCRSLLITQMPSRHAREMTRSGSRTRYGF